MIQEVSRLQSTGGLWVEHHGMAAARSEVLARATAFEESCVGITDSVRFVRKEKTQEGLIRFEERAFGGTAADVEDLFLNPDRELPADARKTVELLAERLPSPPRAIVLETFVHTRMDRIQLDGALLAEEFWVPAEGEDSHRPAVQVAVGFVARAFQRQGIYHHPEPGFLLGFCRPESDDSAESSRHHEVSAYTVRNDFFWWYSRGRSHCGKVLRARQANWTDPPTAMPYHLVTFGVDFALDDEFGVLWVRPSADTPLRILSTNVPRGFAPFLAAAESEIVPLFAHKEQSASMIKSATKG